MMPISHYVGLILSHGVQMCSFFSIICCKRLENASRYTTRLKQLTLVMNIGYLDFDGPSEQSPSVSRAKTHMTLKCTFWSKIRLFGGSGKYSGKALLTFFFTGKAKVHWLGIKVEQFELSSFAEPKSPAETFTATLTSFSDPRLQGPRRALCAIRSHLAVES